MKVRPDPLSVVTLLAFAFSATEPASAGVYKQIYAFQGGSDGANPTGKLRDFGSLMYATTYNGGGGVLCPGGCGTVYTLDPKTGVETVVYSFQGMPDGAHPYDRILPLNGTYYGTTTSGGAADAGAVFSISKSTGAESVLYSFTGGSDGGTPYGGLSSIGNVIYGTTEVGGALAEGTAFALDPNSGQETVIHSFTGVGDGAVPADTMIPVKGVLYGTTVLGGSRQAGTVFSLDPMTGSEIVLHSFQGGTDDGSNSFARTINLGGMLYGTTTAGGAHGLGTVFSLDPVTKVETLMYSFKGGADGANPSAKLLAVHGTLYGTTYTGGTGGCVGGCGTIFSVDKKTGNEVVLYSFQGGADGSHPEASLIPHKGVLYGTTNDGGASDQGTIYTYTP